MRVLVACEFSGVVRRAFRAWGHDAWSCDLLPAEDSSAQHHQCDVRRVLTANRWDLMVAHPPCTYLCKSGARWMRDPGRLEKMQEAIEFVRTLLFAPIPRICIENPSGVLSKAIRKPDQSIQPWQFGHGEVKETCLWLVGLPLLKPTKIVDGRAPRVHYAAPGPNRWKERSRTLPGIAEAMAAQWGTPGHSLVSTVTEPGHSLAIGAA